MCILGLTKYNGTYFNYLFCLCCVSFHCEVISISVGLSLWFYTVISSTSKSVPRRQLMLNKYLLTKWMRVIPRGTLPSKNSLYHSIIWQNRVRAIIKFPCIELVIFSNQLNIRCLLCLIPSCIKWWTEGRCLPQDMAMVRQGPVNSGALLSVLSCYKSTDLYAQHLVSLRIDEL